MYWVNTGVFTFLTRVKILTLNIYLPSKEQIDPDGIYFGKKFTDFLEEVCSCSFRSEQ